MLRERRHEDRLAPARDPVSPGIIRGIQERDARTGTYMYRNRPEAALASLLAALVILASPVSAAAAGQGGSSLAPSVDRMTSRARRRARRSATSPDRAWSRAGREPLAPGGRRCGELRGIRTSQLCRGRCHAKGAPRPDGPVARADRRVVQRDEPGVPLAGRRRGGADPALRRVVRRLRSGCARE